MTKKGILMSRIAPAVPLLGLTLLGCSGPSMALPAEMPPQPMPPATTTSAPQAAPNTSNGVGACYEGECRITVSGPTSFRVDPSRFGFSTVSVSSIGSRNVLVKATRPGMTLRSTVTVGSQSRLNELGIRALNVSDGTADLQFFQW